MKQRTGYSLMELLVCMSILAVCLLMVIGLFLSMSAQTHNDGERVQVSGFLEAYQAEVKGKTEAEWLTLMSGGPFSETRTLLGQKIDVETTVTRESAVSTSADFQVYNLETVARWERKGSGASSAGEKSRLRLISQMSPTGRY